MSALQLHNFYPKSRPESVILERFAAQVAALSAGAVTVSVRHGNDMKLDDAEGLDWLSAGKADLAVLWPVFMQQKNEEYRSSYIMGSARSLEDHVRVFPALEQINTTILAERDIVPIAYLPSPVLYISVFAAGTPVTSLSDLKGRKLRVFSRDLEPTFQRLGVDARFIPQGELYDALAAGIFDCTIYPACHTAWSVPLWRVTHHASYLFPEALHPYLLCAPRRLWEKLGGREQSALREAGRLVYPDFLRLAFDPTDERAARRNLTAAGLTWHDDFSPADQVRFAESAQQTWTDMSRAAGARAESNLRTMLAAMGRDPA